MTTRQPAPVEQALVTYLTTALTPITVATKVPNPRPATFVRLSRVGGDERNLVQADVRVLVEGWGNTDTLAWDAAKNAAGELRRLDLSGDLPTITVMRVRLTEPVNYPDSLSGSPRYQFIASLIVNLKETA